MAANRYLASDSKSIKSSQMEFNTSSKLYCVCRSSNIDTFMICCDFCEEWFHGDCIGVTENSSKDIEMFYCKRCRSSNSNLRITYKKKNARKNLSKTPVKSKTPINYTPTKMADIANEFVSSDVLSSLNLVPVTENQSTNKGTPDPRTSNDEALAIIFQSDTTRRKAKTIANKIIMDQNEAVSAPPKVPKCKNSPILKQCYGPECTKAARARSKYCSDACGVKLGTNRILEVLPQRLAQRKSVPCVADDTSKKKLTAIRRQKEKLYSDIQQTDIKIVQLLQLVRKARSSKEDLIIEDENEDEHSTLYCKLCGTEMQTRFLLRHMEHCYKKLERHLMLTDGDATTKPDDLEWNIFCNHKMGKQGLCKQLKVLCPLHHRDRHKNDGEVCGFPFTMNLAECSGKFCGRLRKECLQHSKNWEENFRADMDLQKLKFLVELSKLEKEELEIRRDMAARGNLLALLMNQTVVH